MAPKKSERGFRPCSALVMFGFCLVTRRPVRMNRNQHLAALGQGAFVFAASYGFVYAAEERVASAVVAVMFAALAFLNLGSGPIDVRRWI